MCIDAKTSITTFIIASILNCMVFTSTSNVNYLMMSGVYQFIIMIQLFDFMVWKDQKCGKLNKIGTRSIFTATLLQPIVIANIILLFTKVIDKYEILIVILIFIIYTAFLFNKLYFSKNYKTVTCLKPTDECSHLDYSWWKKPLNEDKVLNTGVAGILYSTGILLSVLLLVKTFKFAAIHAVYIIVSGLLGNILYSCGEPSMWCLMATGGPLLNYILMKNNV